MNKLTAMLWFDKEAEEAMNHYLSIFPDSKQLSVSRYGAAGPGPAGTVMTASFEIEGYQFTALNGGPLFKFNESVSFVVRCKDQAEVDYYWHKLSAGGAPSACGWLKDKFGLSWQVVPVQLIEMLSDKDGARAQRVMGAMMKMGKIVIADLQAAYGGK